MPRIIGVPNSVTVKHTAAWRYAVLLAGALPIVIYPLYHAAANYTAPVVSKKIVSVITYVLCPKKNIKFFPLQIEFNVPRASNVHTKSVQRTWVMVPIFLVIVMAYVPFFMYKVPLLLSPTMWIRPFCFFALVGQNG